LPVSTFTSSDIVILLFLGVFQIGLAYVCLSSGIGGVPALEASLLLLLEPVLNPVWAWLVHGEVPTGWALAGGAIIMTATTVRTLWDVRN
jgi:drug/metabolite transporter (DMT)-like permease